MRVENMIGAELDAWVVQALGWREHQRLPAGSPSRDWAVGGPLVERERITLIERGREWHAAHPDGGRQVGTSPLVAAMRAFVAARLGEDPR